ncbi:hydrogenase large subunit [Sulfurospirillum sp. 1612]|uniref:hydrogenase large subunit n=1 Tax=Sulfurospirillum sp. 1612 TaxID=3094835 RepID=UPI002F959942
MRLIARFCVEHHDHFEIITLFDTSITRVKLEKEHPVLDSIASEYPAAIWFERKIKDDFGIAIHNTFDNRPLVHHERFPNLAPMRKDFKDSTIEFCDFVPYKYESIHGDGVFQIAVGPIHAGIIEPGHFQFSQAGEHMLHLEVRHFYKYRAIEKMLEGKTLFEAKAIIERISGNESIAYQIAWFKILLQASGMEYPLKLQKYHALLLEMERLIHHLNDIGFIGNDAGFGAGLAICSKLSEESRRMLQAISGHRFGFGAIGFEAPAYDYEKLRKFLSDLDRDIKWLEDWIVDVPSLWDRFDTTGILTLSKAIKYSTVGVLARASGLAIDHRVTEPIYKDAGFIMQTQSSGDVGARFLLRIKEVRQSIGIIKNLIDHHPTHLSKPTAFATGEFMSFAESSLGELFMYVKLKEGKIDRFYSRDPSFINWQALYLLMSRDIIADFPLINKSCDLSYAGNDL